MHSRNRLLSSHISQFNKYLTGLFILNLFQAVHTPVLGDEAHYWVWSHQLAWGYFDHPPMVAFLIRLSSLLFNGETGIRFATVLTNTLTAAILWKLIPAENRKRPHSVLYFFALLLSVPVFHLYGFVATPDAPLFLSFSLFLLALKRLDTRESLLNYLFLGVSAALMIYSKYHAGILLLLSVAFRPDLLKRTGTYFSGIIALLLIAPHLLWEYNHDFISLDYHLFQRTDGSFRIGHVLGFFPAMLAALNPGLIFLQIWSFRKPEPEASKTNRFYYRIFLGYTGFFFLYSFRSQVDAHWMGAAFIPMILILHGWCMTNDPGRNWFKYISSISMLILIILRIMITLPFPALTGFQKEGRHFFNTIEQQAEGRKVVFVNSYRRASKYSFYTGEMAYSSDNSWYRKTYYDTWDKDTAFHRKEVLLIGDYPSPFFDSVLVKNGEAFLSAAIRDFKVFTKVRANVPEWPDRLRLGNRQPISLELENRHTYDLDLRPDSMPLQISIELSGYDNKFYIPVELDIQILKSGERLVVHGSVMPADIPPGNYSGAITMRSGYLYHQLIGPGSEVMLEPEGQDP